jgi:hypothetical protein
MRIRNKENKSDLATKKPLWHRKEIPEKGRKRPLNINGKYNPTILLQ